MALISLLLFVGLSLAQSPVNAATHKIVGGQKIDIKDAPYQATVWESATRAKCGAVILDKRWVLTAAHCLGRLKYVRVGQTNLNDPAPLVPIDKIFGHPDWNTPTYNADIALVRLKQDLTFSDKVKPIELAARNEQPVTGAMTVVSGFGSTIQRPKHHIFGVRDDDNDRETLRAVEVPVYDIVKCAKIYEALHLEVNNTQFCAGFEEGGKDSCQGDSGGPIISKDSKKVIGVVSYGKGCAWPKFPGVYANIADPSIRDWIKKTSGL